MSQRGFSAHSLVGVSVCAGILFLSAINAHAQTEKTIYSFCSAAHCSDGSFSNGVAFDAASGNVFGVAYYGGNKNGCGVTPRTCNGVVYEFTPSTSSYSVLYKFCKQPGCSDGENPYHVRLVVDSAGNLYGTTEYGGNRSNGGVVFELSPGQKGWKEKVLYTFCSQFHCKDGFNVQSGLTYAGESSGQPYDGVSPLYGTTLYGGAYKSGTVFSLTPKTGTKKWAERVLYSFCAQSDCVDGMWPAAVPAIDERGNLFGTTIFGGQFGSGAVFELVSNGDSYFENVAYSFCAEANCTDGEEPSGGVTVDASGNLFGTTEEGGSSNYGVLFELTAGSLWQYNVLTNFDITNGANPSGPPTLDGSGGVYGTTAGFTDGIGATVFDFNGTLQTLYTFCAGKGCPDGSFPNSNLVLDNSGNIIGTTQTGARRNSGTLFMVSPAAKR